MTRSVAKSLQPPDDGGFRAGVLRFFILRILTIVAASSVGCDRGTDAGGVELRVANWGGPANLSEFLELDRGIQRAFEAAHADRGVRVVIEQIPGEGQYTSKLMMMHLAGNMPDVAHLDASSAAVFVDNGVMMDLSARIASDPDVEEGMFFPNVVDIARRGEKVYALPLDFTPMVIVYNRRLFDRAGVAYPQEGWTREEFLTTCAALKQRPLSESEVWYPIDFFNWMPGWYPFLLAGGGDVLTSDGRGAVGALNAPASVASLRFIVDMILRDGYAPHPRVRTAVGKDLFRAELSAMTLTGHWMMLEYRRDGLDVGVVSVPHTGERKTVMYACSLAIPVQARNPDLAWAFVKHMTSTEVQKLRNSTGLAISANRAAAEALATDDVEGAFLREVRFARPPWGARVERYPVIEEFGWEMMEDVLHGGVSVETAASETAKLIEHELQ